MRLIFRVIGWLIVGFGLALGARDALSSRQDGEWAFESLGELWYAVHPNSLELLQPAIERHVSEDLWFSVIQPVLEAPAFIPFLVLGLLILLIVALAGVKKGDRRRKR